MNGNCVALGGWPGNGTPEQGHVSTVVAVVLALPLCGVGTARMATIYYPSWPPSLGAGALISAADKGPGFPPETGGQILLERKRGPGRCPGRMLAAEGQEHHTGSVR